MSLRVLHLPTATGGNAWGLAQAERTLGIQSDVLVLHDTSMQYPFDFTLDTWPLTSSMATLKMIITRIKDILNIRKNYDVFHFNFGTSLIDYPEINLTLADLPLFQQKGKKNFVTYKGCDARQKYRTIQRVSSAACHESNCYGGMCDSGKRDEERRKKIDRFDKYAHHVFALNPDLLYVLPQRSHFLPYTIARWNEIETIPYQTPQKRIKIVHAPTNHVSKGSSYILAALQKLQHKYPDQIDILIIEGKSHSEALEIYKTADLVIDQIMIGWYGALAVEVMKMGKPVMVFIREEDLKFIHPEMASDCKKTFILANKETIYDALCKLVENKDILINHHYASLEYVQKWHNPLDTAKKKIQSEYEK